MFGEHIHNDQSHNLDAPPTSTPAAPQPPQAEHTTKKEDTLFEILKIVFLAVLIVVPIRVFIAQPFVVSGASMDPTFENGEYIIVDQLSYNFNQPKRGDVIVFRFPLEPSKFFIKRIVGLPGEQLILQKKATIIINSEHPEGIIFNEPYVAPENMKTGSFSVVLGEGEYFVMGDNRAESSDSRSWGPINKEHIAGKAFIRLFPITHIDFLPGSIK
ncbi:MAG: signal peptidase I [Candidatus Pacebacteria bacterium]|nr:signal peptidase I [Candidatus Paceibacterota bacterium]